MIVDMVDSDSAPALRYEVNNLTVNPTSAAVVFTLMTDAGIAVTLAGTASITGITSSTIGGVTYYDATLVYTWAAADTATPGAYTGRFQVTLAAGAGVLTLPADTSLRIRIHPAATTPAP